MLDTTYRLLFSILMYLEDTYDIWNGLQKKIFVPDDIAGLEKDLHGPLQYIEADCSPDTGFSLRFPAIDTEDESHPLSSLGEHKLQAIVNYLQNRKCCLKKGAKQLDTEINRYLSSVVRPMGDGTDLSAKGVRSLLTEYNPYSENAVLAKARALGYDDSIESVLQAIDEHPKEFMWLININRVPTLKSYLSSRETSIASDLKRAFNATKVWVEDESTRYKLVTYEDENGTVHERAGFYDATLNRAFILMDELEVPVGLGDVHKYNWVKPGSMDVTTLIYRIASPVHRDLKDDIRIVETTQRLIKIVGTYLKMEYRVLKGDRESLLVYVDPYTRYYFTVNRDEKIMDYCVYELSPRAFPENPGLD